MSSEYVNCRDAIPTYVLVYILGDLSDDDSDLFFS